MKHFKAPNFGEKHLEFKVEGGEICIYADEHGLKRLAEFCQKLLADSKAAHIHLEDYEVLTSESMKATLAVFPSTPRKS